MPRRAIKLVGIAGWALMCPKRRSASGRLIWATNLALLTKVSPALPFTWQPAIDNSGQVLPATDVGLPRSKTHTKPKSLEPLRATIVEDLTGREWWRCKARRPTLECLN
jgi:hypothetical protein